MKKLLMLVAAVLAVATLNVTANCYRNSCRTKRTCQKSCVKKEPCAKICQTVVNEGPMPTRCCKKLIEVQEAPLLTKHVDVWYTCECPPTCNEIVGEVYFKDGEETKTHVIDSGRSGKAMSAKTAAAA